MNVFYNRKIIKNSNFLTVSETQIEPEIQLTVNYFASLHNFEI